MLLSKIVEYVRKDGTLNKEWKNGETLLNATNLNALANNLQTIITWKENLPSWVKSNGKPVYTASEVGADVAGTAVNVVNVHNHSADAHDGVLAKINHTHNINTIVGFPTTVSGSNFSANRASVLTKVEDEGDLSFRKVSPVTFSGDFRDLINAPTGIPTKLSDLDNDVGYLTQSDLSQLSRGSWAGGTLSHKDEWSTFITGFKPDYVYITYRVNGTNYRCIIDSNLIYKIENTERIKIDYIEYTLTDYGFLLQDTSQVYNELNRPGISYKYVAVGRGIVDLPYVSYEDDDKMLQVVDGQWQKVNPTAKQLPTITPDDAGSLLMAMYEDGQPYSVWQQIGIADGGQY